MAQAEKIAILVPRQDILDPRPAGMMSPTGERRSTSFKSFSSQPMVTHGRSKQAGRTLPITARGTASRATVETESLGST